MFLAQKDQDLGLTLTLGGGGGSSSSKPTTSNTPFNLNMMMMGSSSSSSSSPTPFGFLHKLPWNTSTDPDRTFVRGIDVNRSAGTVEEEEEEEAGMSSPNSTVSTVSGGNKRSGVEIDQSATTVGPSDDIELERTSSRGMSDEEDGSDNSRKKLRLTKDQSAILEDSFKEHNTLNPKQKLALARRLGLRPRQVEVWFQNRRARTKLKQTEVDCEFLKRCCEQLTEENRRLQKEVAELRALKLSPQFYMQMTPPTTLTVCTSCERAAAPPTPPGQSGSEYRPGPAHHRGVNPWVATTPVPIRPL